MQMQRRDMIMRQRESGIAGAMSSLEKSNREVGGVPKFGLGGSAFAGSGFTKFGKDQ